MGTEDEYIKQAIAAHKICGDGEFTKKCNAWLENRFKAQKVLLTTSGTTALDMVALLCNIQPGDEVILPSYTFSSTATAFVLAGAKLVFVDIRPDTMNIDENNLNILLKEAMLLLVYVLEQIFMVVFFNLYDMGITNFSRGEVDSNNCTGNLFGNWGLYYDIVGGALPTDNLRNAVDYLDNNKDDLIVLLSAKDEASNSLTEEMIQTMQSLGLEFDLANHYRWSYLAVIDSGNVVYEDMSDNKLEQETEIAGNKIDMQSAGYETGNIASIKINGLEYALNKRGINIVVYDKQANRVIDSVRIDTYIGDELTR